MKDTVTPSATLTGMEVIITAEPVRVDDLFTGIYCALVARRASWWRTGPDTDELLAAITHELANEGYNLRFRIIPGIHGTSETVADAMMALYWRYMFRWEGQVMYMLYNTDHCAEITKELPHMQLADRIAKRLLVARAAG